jgi:hypothetical protein
MEMGRQRRGENDDSGARRCDIPGVDELRAGRVLVRHRQGLSAFYRVIWGGERMINSRWQVRNQLIGYEAEAGGKGDGAALT